MSSPEELFKSTPIFRSKKLWAFLGAVVLVVVMKIALPSNEKSYTNEEKKLNHEKVLAIIAAPPSTNFGGNEKNGQLNSESNLKLANLKSPVTKIPDTKLSVTLPSEALAKNAILPEKSQLEMKASEDGNQSELDSTEENKESDLYSQADQETEAVDKTNIPSQEKPKQAVTCSIPPKWTGLIPPKWTA